jgi:hypothetical protein
MENDARQSEEYRLLEVKVVRHALEQHRFTWRVLCDGQLVGYSSQSYSNEADAFRVGNAAAPAIRRLRTASPVRFGG